MEIAPEESEDATEAVDGVHLKLLARGENANLQHFFIEPGATVPEHSHARATGLRPPGDAHVRRRRRGDAGR